MTASIRSLVAALAGFVLLSQAEAAPIPAGVGDSLDAAAPVELVQFRGGGRGGMGPRGIGPRGMGPRGFGPRGFGPRGFGPRPGWGPRYGWRGGPGWRRSIYWGAPAFGAAALWGAPGYAAYDDCLRQGWLWNGYRYAWSTFRIC